MAPDKRSTEAPTVIAAEFLAAASQRKELPPPVDLEVAFAGRSNVGKSTLLNALMSRRGLARTSSTPGCTRTINFFRVKTRDGASLSFVDLPGYGYAKRAKTERDQWADLIEGYLLERPALALVLVLVDARRGLESDDLDLLKMIHEPRPGRTQPKTLIVGTKLDKVPRSQQLSTIKALESSGHRVIGASNEDPKLIAALWRRIRGQLGLTEAASNTG
jgi:GTP-binding protein